MPDRFPDVCLLNLSMSGSRELCACVPSGGVDILGIHNSGQAIRVV